MNLVKKKITSRDQWKGGKVGKALNLFFVQLVIILFAERQADSEILSSSIITLRIENIAGPTVCFQPY